VTALFFLVLVTLFLGGLNWDRERPPDCLWWVRVSPTTTIEVRRRGGFGLYFKINSRGVE
jgi:hypothetical protein